MKAVREILEKRTCFIKLVIYSIREIVYALSLTV